MTMRWVVDRATNQFLYGGFYTPESDPVTQIVVDLDEVPDTLAERYDPGSKTLRRPALANEVAAMVLAQVDDQVTVQSQDPDLLAMIAFVVYMTTGVWPTAKTLPQAVATWKDGMKQTRVLLS